MTFQIEIDGRAHSAAIERTGEGRFRVVIQRDGSNRVDAHMVDAVRVGEYGLSLLLENGSASREVQVTPGGARGEILVAIEGKLVAAAINGRSRRRASGDTTRSGHGEQSIVAPMPGRVVRVLVGPGDEVQARQPLVVVEAMKMENELRAPKSGTIKAVAVTAGMSVEAGRVLVTVA